MNNFNNIELKNLLFISFYRTKDRFLNYFLAIILGVALNSISLIFALIGLFVFKSGLIFVVLLFLSSLVSIYVTTWSLLAITKTIINPEKIGAITAYKNTLPLVKGYLLFTILSAFFYLLLTPIFALTLFIELFFWYVYRIYSQFIYLEKGKKGLDILWYSKALVEKKRIIFLYIIGFGLIDLILEFLIPSSSNILKITKVAIFLIFGPFFTSFLYEIYRSIDLQEDVKPAHNWIAAGVISWIFLLVVILILLLSKLLTNPFNKLYQRLFINPKNNYENTLSHSGILPPFRFLPTLTPTRPSSTLIPTQSQLLTPSPIIYPELIGYWTLDNIDHKNQIYNSTTLKNDGVAFNITIVPGKIDQAVSFKGTNKSSVEIIDPSLRKVDNDFTISLWANRLNEGNTILAWMLNYDNGGFGIIAGAKGELYCRTKDGATGTYVDSYTDYQGGYLLAGNGWHNIAIVRKYNQCNIYIDGKDRTMTHGFHDNLGKYPNTFFYLGGGEPTGGLMFKGEIDNVRLYNYARTPEEIIQDMK